MSQTGCGSDLGSMCVCGNCNRWRVTDCAMIYNKAKDALKMEYEILIIQKLERIDCQTGSIGHETTFEQRLTDGERTGPLPFPFNWPAVFAFLLASVQHRLPSRPRLFPIYCFFSCVIDRFFHGGLCVCVSVCLPPIVSIRDATTQSCNNIAACLYRHFAS